MYGGGLVGEQGGRYVAGSELVSVIAARGVAAVAWLTFGHTASS